MDTWLTEKQRSSWAKGKLTELLIYWESNNIDSAKAKVIRH
jgi:hypothetical protein